MERIGWWIFWAALGMGLAFGVDFVRRQWAFRRRDLPARIRELGGEREVIAMFQRRRARARRSVLLSYVTVLVLWLGILLLLGIEGFPSTFLGLKGEIWVAAGLLLSIPQALSLLAYGCPVCEQWPLKHRWYGSHIVDFNPEACRTCGVRLR